MEEYFPIERPGQKKDFSSSAQSEQAQLVRKNIQVKQKEIVNELKDDKDVWETF